MAKEKFAFSTCFWCLMILVAIMSSSTKGQNVSPCPRIFQYVFDGADWIGLLEIPSPMIGETVTIHVILTIRAVLPTNYFGKIELVSTRSLILQDILARRPVRYRVRFPLPDPIPKLSSIILNGRTICQGRQDVGGVVTTIKLEHTLYTNNDYGQPPLTMYGMEHEQFSIGFGGTDSNESHQNGDNDLWSYYRPNRPIQSFNPPFNPPSTTNPIYSGNYPQNQNQWSSGGGTQFGRPQVPINNRPTQQQGSNQFQPGVDWGNLAPQSTRPTFGQNVGAPTTPPPFKPQPVFRPPVTSTPPRVGESSVLTEMNSICGQSVPRPINLVVGGEVTSKGDWPWLVALYVITDTGLNFKCGSTLVSRRLVVTAAHCLFGSDNRQFDNDNILLIVGRYNINDWTDDAIRAPIERALPHPDYRPNTIGTDADIALLILRIRIEFTDFIRPICLWQGSSDLQRVIGLNATVVGWGRDESGRKTTPEPRMARVPVVSRETCLLSKEEFRHLITSNRTFCAGARGSGPCNGDSGGGLMLPQGDRWTLRGIVSVSLVDQITKQCDVNEFIVFTDATQFHDWIVSHMFE